MIYKYKGTDGRKELRKALVEAEKGKCIQSKVEETKP